MSSLYIKNIEKIYKSQEKRSFHLEVNELKVQEGEFFGLIGSSGCGKSTLLKLIAGLIELDHGAIHLDENDITKTPTTERNIGMIFQEPLLFPHMSVEENVGFGLKMLKLKKRERREKVAGILKSVGLEGFEERYPNELSGGQQQRVSIARALVCEPKILLMDEPFSALDMKLREDMRILIKKLHSENNMTIIFITHDKDEAFDLFTNMGVMRDGKVLQVGTPEEVYRSPVNVYVAQLLGIDNIIKGEVHGDRFIDGELEFQIKTHHEKEAGYLIVPSESVSLSGITDEKCSGNKGVIENVRFTGGFREFTVRCGENRLKSLQNLTNNFKKDDKVLLKIEGESAHFVSDSNI